MPPKFQPKQGMTLSHIIESSRMYYKAFDNKKARADMDVQSARMRRRTNYIFNLLKKAWVSNEEQTGQKDNSLRLDFVVKTRPISYKSPSAVGIHKYPITFLLEDTTLGIHTPFKWRTGSFKKPMFAKKGIKPKARQKITERNIRQGVQMQFFFDLEYILDKFGLLYGPNWATRAPVKTNPQLIPFFDKHAWFVVESIILPFLKNPDTVSEKVEG